MGVLLVVSVVVLAFLCGRLQITVGALSKRVESLEVEQKSFRHAAKYFEED